MRNQTRWLVGLLGGLLLVATLARAAPGETAPPATSPATKKSPSAPPRADPVPVPEGSAGARPARSGVVVPVSIEHDEELAYANKLLWWGGGFSAGGLLLVAVGSPLVYMCFQPGNDEFCGGGWGIFLLGVVAVLAATPVWVVGLIKRRKAKRKLSERAYLPRPRVVVDGVHRRDQRRVLRVSGPRTVPVLSYRFRF